MYTVNSGRNYAHVAFLPSLFPSFIPGLFFASYLCHHQYSAIYIYQATFASVVHCAVWHHA